MNEQLPPVLNSGMNSIDILISDLLSARSIFHILHLRATDYNTHILLNEMYELIEDILDSIAESYQATSGKLINISRLESLSLKDVNFKDLVKLIYDNLIRNRDSELVKELNLEPEFDESLTKYRSLMYKFKFLTKDNTTTSSL